MSYWVYKSITTINDQSLITESAEITVLSILYFIFRPANLQPHADVVNLYIAEGIQKGYKRYLDQNRLITERVFENESIAREYKSQLDVFYEDNLSYQTEEGYDDKFTFQFDVYEISDSEFASTYNL